MSHEMHLVQHAKAPADAVWAVLVDVEGAKATLSGVTKIEVLTPGQYTEGFRWRETRKMLGKEQTEEMWVASVDAPRSTTIRSDSRGTAYTTRFTLAPTDDGTNVTMFFGAELERPGVGSRLMMAMFGRLGMRIVRKAMDKDLRQIVAKAEQVTS